MNDSTWFMLVFWIVLVLLGSILKKPVVGLFGAIFGIYASLTLYSEASFYTLIGVLTNIYLGYVSLTEWDL